MNRKPLIIVAGEPFSIFSEIFLKIYKKKNKKNKISNNINCIKKTISKTDV